MFDDPDLRNINGLSTLLNDTLLNVMPDNKSLLSDALDKAIRECGGIDAFAAKVNVPSTEFFAYNGKLQVKADLWRKLMPVLKDDVEKRLSEYPKKKIQQRIDEILSRRGADSWKDIEKDIDAAALALEEDVKIQGIVSQLTILLFVFPEDDPHA